MSFNLGFPLASQASAMGLRMGLRDVSLLVPSFCFLPNSNFPSVCSPPLVGYFFITAGAKSCAGTSAWVISVRLTASPCCISWNSAVNSPFPLVNSRLWMRIIYNIAAFVLWVITSWALLLSWRMFSTMLTMWRKRGHAPPNRAKSRFVNLLIMTMKSSADSGTFA